MINKNDVIPNLSHPIRRHNMFGIKTKKFIDKINNKTIYVNRNLLKSCLI